MCFQSLHLAGSKNQTLHFKHNPGSEDCPVESTCELTHDEILAIKYNGQKEGLLHKKYKLLIANHFLSDSSFTNVFVEKTFREKSETGVAKQWRRPDVIAERKFGSLKVAFELQVSTTFIDVIIARESFYKNNNLVIFWVFLKFNNSKFTEKDIFYSSNYNAFVFDIEAKLTSDVSGEFHLKCYFTDFELVEGEGLWTLEDEGMGGMSVSAGTIEEAIEGYRANYNEGDDYQPVEFVRQNKRVK